MNIKQMIDQIREIIGGTDRDISEAEVLSALLDEAEFWRARLDEISDDDL